MSHYSVYEFEKLLKKTELMVYEKMTMNEQQAQKVGWIWKKTSKVANM